jgi:hypothetical protein
MQSLETDPERIVGILHDVVEDGPGWTLERLEGEGFGPDVIEAWDLAIAMNLAERRVSRQLRLAYIAPEVLKRLVFGREVSAVTVMQLTESAALPWVERAGVVFGTTN